MIEIFFRDENVSYDGLCGLDLPLDRKEGIPEVVLPVDEIYTGYTVTNWTAARMSPYF
jgi:hypothetical protein